MEQTISRTMNLLKSPMHFLMFRGGSGGEFLSKQIYKYSNKHSANGVTLNSNEELNKTTVTYPSFFNRLINVQKRNPDTLKTMLSGTSESELFEAEEYLKSFGDNTPLFRCHYINDDYYRSRSYFIFLDNVKWWNYAGALVSIKNREQVSGEIPLNVFLSNFYKRFYTIKDYVNEEIAIKQFLIGFPEKELTDAHLIIASNKQARESHSVEELLNYDIKTLYQEYNTVLHGDYADYDRIVKRDKFMKLINYSNYFDKGYLEDIFEIESDLFHDELIAWHEKNLELLSANGFDIEEFKLS